MCNAIVISISRRKMLYLNCTASSWIPYHCWRVLCRSAVRSHRSFPQHTGNSASLSTITERIAYCHQLIFRWTATGKVHSEPQLFTPSRVNILQRQLKRCMQLAAAVTDRYVNNSNKYPRVLTRCFTIATTSCVTVFMQGSVGRQRVVVGVRIGSSFATAAGRTFNLAVLINHFIDERWHFTWVRQQELGKFSWRQVK